jgi:replicative DNA helicase
MSGVATGFEKLDKITSGWQPSDLIIIAARPAMGKHLYLWHVIWQLIMECR